LLWRAPDWRAFYIAAKMSNYTLNKHGFKLTQEICKYLWSWAHRLRIDVDADSQA
jgi:hypothetical protein